MVPALAVLYRAEAASKAGCIRWLARKNGREKNDYESMFTRVVSVILLSDDAEFVKADESKEKNVFFEKKSHQNTLTTLGTKL